MNDPTGNNQHETIRGQPRLIFWFAIILPLLHECIEIFISREKEKKKDWKLHGCNYFKKPTISCCMCYESSRVTSLEQLSLAEFSGV